MSMDKIVEIIVMYVAPYFITCIPMVAMIIKHLIEFKRMKKMIVDTRSNEEIKVQVKRVLDENYELKQTINELLTKIDHIERK